MRHALLAMTAAFAAAWLATPARVGAAPEAAQPVKPAQVTGDWTGTWGAMAQKPSPTANTPGALLECKVVALSDGKFQATFAGECGRPYKYVIQVPGRAVGGVVLFQGSADLGEKDGGVYDWIGRATDKEFVGFFTSQGHVGQFKLARPPAPSQ